MSHADLAGMRLLVVEDDAMVRGVIARTARVYGLEVDEADGGAPALALLADTEYDVLITDLKMPSISGFAVIERVRETCPGAAVIVITGFAEDDLEARVARAGGLLLSKPFNMEQLLGALHWARERGARPPEPA